MILLLINSYFQGKGTMMWKKSGAIYDGDWKDDRRCGFGTFSVSEGAGYRKVYSGGWKNDKRHVSVYYAMQVIETSKNHFGTQNQENRVICN